MTLRIATCAYPIEPLSSFAQFAEKQSVWVAQAARHGAQLLVYPEYASVELTSALPDAQQGALARELTAMAPLLEPMLSLFDTLARQHDVYILSPSFPERVTPPERYHNRARLHTPSGAHSFTEKLQMTRFEAEEWGVSAGSIARVFETELGTFGVAICYDVEFPLLVRRQVAAGADVLLVPSCTDTVAGHQRVSLSCRARALENQCFVVKASIVGEAPWSIPLDRNIGTAAVYGPVEEAFFPDGVVAEGALNESGWVYAELDLASLAAARRDGQVQNHRDWDSPRHLDHSVERVALLAR